MKKSRLFCAFAILAAGVVTGATTVRASSVAYDTDVNTPPGVFFGSGNPNGGFVVDTENGVQVGLRAKYRQAGTVLSTSGTGTYNVVTGPETTTTSGNSLSNPNRAAWNWEFVVNVGGNPYNPFLSGYTANVTITDNLGDSPVTLDVLSFYGDNALYAPIDPTKPSVAENSENMVFGPFPSFDMNKDATYTYSLSVFNKAAPTFIDASASMTVIVGDGGPGVGGSAAPVVPLPASMYSGLALLGGMLLYRFVRKNRVAIV